MLGISRLTEDAWTCKW